MVLCGVGPLLALNQTGGGYSQKKRWLLTLKTKIATIYYLMIRWSRSIELNG